MGEVTPAAGSGIRAVLFDWGGVFTNPPMMELRALEGELGYAHRQLLDWLFYSGVRTGPGGEQCEPDFHLLDKAAITIEEFHSRVLARAAEYLGTPMAKETYASICDLFVDNPGIHTVHWAMVERARRLRREGYRVAIVTNQIATWREFWRTSIPLEEFELIIDSCVVGLRKPEPEILRIACDGLGVEPHEAVLLDDSPRNIAAAQAMGLSGILVRDPVQAIAELDELLAGAPSVIS